MPLGRTRHQPGQRRADPDVRRRLRADGVRHRRDHGRARPRRARLRLRDEVRPADPRASIERRRRAALHRRRPARQLATRASTGMPNREALEAIVDWLDGEGRGHRSINYRLRDWLLSRQRYWGCPIPIVYCDALRDGAGAGGPAAGRAARRRRLRAARAARRWPRPRTGSTRPARAAAARRGARPTRWTRSSTRPGTSCATATRTTTRRRGIPTCSRAGCRSTSTSAASSTRSCT